MTASAHEVLPLSPVLAIAGPTASGKTSLAIRLAQALGGEIINIDSVQIFRGCRVGAAQPSPEELSSVRHHLVAALEPEEPCNAALYSQMVTACLHEMHARAHRAVPPLPLLCVGTSMYFSALVYGLVSQPAASPEISEEIRSLPLEEAYRRLQVQDPLRAAQLHPHDAQRITRALEAYASSGRPMGEALKGSQLRENIAPLVLVLCFQRQTLHQRIELRTRSMLSQGLVEETQRLRQTFGPDCAVLQTVGYLEACMFLDKKISEPQLFQKICSATRQLAKRQMTYWRNEPLKRGWSCVPQQTPQAINGKPAKGKLALKEFEVLSLSFSELLQKLQLRLRDELKRPEVWYLDAALL